MSSVESSQNFEEIDLETGNNPLLDLDNENEVPEQYRIGKYNADQWVLILSGIPTRIKIRQKTC